MFLKLIHCSKVYTSIFLSILTMGSNHLSFSFIICSPAALNWLLERIFTTCSLFSATFHTISTGGAWFTTYNLSVILVVCTHSIRCPSDIFTAYLSFSAGVTTLQPLLHKKHTLHLISPLLHEFVKCLVNNYDIFVSISTWRDVTGRDGFLAT